LPSSVFEETRHGPGYTRHPRWAQRYITARQRETGTAALSADGETYEPNPSRQCEPMSITMCWIGLARKVSQIRQSRSP
jgi:hypothetical protein